jgi:5-dehydro-4-deoxyglucarate dehydratase
MIDRDPTRLKARLPGGLLSFPVTAFNARGEFDPPRYARLIEKAASGGAVALFAAGGTGEFFSIDAEEYPLIIRTAVQAAAGRLPIIAGCGYGTRTAIKLAKLAEEAGASGLLLLPHYLIDAEQDGLFEHVRTVCRSVSIGVIVYNRDNSVITAQTLRRLADACPNLIGYKDGYGDVELLQSITSSLEDRLTYIGGMPTAEVYASAYKAAGVSTYSSAVYNFIPSQAVAFYDAMTLGEHAVIEGMLRRFFWPYLQLRNRRKGYAVSIIKAGMRAMGLEDPGPVRSPLINLTPQEEEELKCLLHDAFRI